MNPRVYEFSISLERYIQDLTRAVGENNIIGIQQARRGIYRVFREWQQATPAEGLSNDRSA